MHHLLVVDADPGQADRVTSFLCSEAYIVTAVATASEALRTLSDTCLDLILLDLQLAGAGGLELCRRIRRSSALPLIVVSARADVATKLQAFQAGADDFLATPLDPDELLARIWAVLRRAQRVLPGSLQTADLILDPGERRVTLVRSGIIVDLTPDEACLLRVLVSHGGHTLHRDTLRIKVWGDTSADSQLEVIINRLRHKLEADPYRPRLLLSVRGVGYKYQPSELQLELRHAIKAGQAYGPGSATIEAAL